MKPHLPLSPGLVAPPIGLQGVGRTAGASRRWAGLDGLRALAVTAVLVYHFFPAILPGGYIGVDVFFVISGFLITGLLLDEHALTRRISLGRFWSRRVRRLIPPLLPVLLVSATAAWLVGGDVLVGLGRQLLGSLTFSYNWVSIGVNASYFSTDQPELFRNLWSLAVEEQFYLLWPLVLMALLLLPFPRVRIAVIVALAASSALWMGVLYQPGTDPTRVYFGSDTHSFGLAIGAALALLLRLSRHGDELPRLRPWLGLGALLSLAAFAVWMPADSPVAYRGGLVAVAVLTAVAIWAGARAGRFGSMLDVAPMKYIGARSYGIYLWHWPVLILLQLVWPETGEPWIRAVLIGVVGVALTMLAAVASYRWIEQPVRRLGFAGGMRRAAAFLRGSRVQRQSVIAAIAALVVFGAGTVTALASAPTTASAESVIERGREAMESSQSADGAAPSPAVTGPTVVIPYRVETSEAALPGQRMTAVGDSVMLASAPELQEAFPGIAIDAAVSRPMDAGPEILAGLAASGQLRDVVVVGLGTNGPITDAELRELSAAIGPTRQLILVNAFAPRDWTPGVNQTLADYSAHHARVEVADWSSAIAPHTDVLAEDNIHPGPTGGRIYAECINAAMQRLAALPPGQQPGPNRLIQLP